MMALNAKRRNLGLIAASALVLALGCSKDEEGETFSGLDQNAEVGSLSDADATKLCEAIVQIADDTLTREVICTLAGISHGQGDVSACETGKAECVAVDHPVTTERDASMECAGIDATDFAGCGATVAEMESCMEAIIGQVKTITCEDTDGRANEAEIAAACEPLLEDDGCITSTEFGHVVAGSGYVHATGVEVPMMGSGGTGAGTGGASMGGADAGTGGMMASTGGADAGTGGSATDGPPYTKGPSDCSTCSMLDCLLTPKHGFCEGKSQVCYTRVVDQQAGRQITRGCEDPVTLKPKVEANPADCGDIESHVMPNGVTCNFACDGSEESGILNCNHPPNLLTEMGSELFQ